jgi:uncharacterized membrane protein YwzB
MLPVIASIVSGLISNGLPKIADAVLEKGVDYVQDKLGVELKPEGQMKPEDLSRLKEAAMKHEEFLVDAEVRDKANARDMAKHAMTSSDPFVRRFTYYFITVWSIFAIVYIPFITFGYIPQENVRFADTILGFMLGTVMASMFSFLLGSSFGSRAKDDKK